MANYQTYSRFFNGKIIKNRNGDDIIFSRFIDYNSLQAIGSYIIPSGKEHRPDLISLDVYGVDTLGWHIMAFNTIDSPKILKAGVTLKIPPALGIVT